MGRWLNTEPSRLSPDGATYLDGNDGNFRIVDARTGATVRVPKAPDSDFVRVVAFTSTGIYLIKAGITALPGLWRIDPSTGAFSQVSNAAGAWSLVDGRYAWGANGTTLRVIDLTTGASRDVFTSRHRFLDVAGLTAAGVLVFEGDVGLPTNWASLIGPDDSAFPVPMPDDLRGQSLIGFFKVGSAIAIVGQRMSLAAYDPDHGLKVLASGLDLYRVLGSCAVA